MKRCTDCSCQKPVRCFYRSARYSSGRVSHCKLCCGKRYRFWALVNREKKNAAQKKYRRAHPERVRASAQASYLKYRDRRRELNNARNRKEYHQDVEKSRAYNRKKRKRCCVIKRRAYARRYVKERGRRDSLFRIRRNMSSRLSACLKGTLKSAPFWRLVGCSKERLRKRLQAAFKPGMTWKNYGSVWHVDHKKPCILFDLMDPAQQRKCFHYSNLQPLFVEENLSKGDLYA